MRPSSGQTPSVYLNFSKYNLSSIYNAYHTGIIHIYIYIHGHQPDYITLLACACG